MKDWLRIRRERLDLTDYIVHLTKTKYLPEQKVVLSGRDMLLRILDDGHVKATFAPLPNRYSPSHPQPTVRGPNPAVCLTEQPLWALLKSLKCFAGRYTGYGIAYHKVPLYWRGARPVIYGNKNTLAALPDEMKHLFVTYEPTSDPDLHPVDFTWEREWRIIPRRLPSHLDDHLELDVDNSAHPNASGAVIVRYDKDVPVIEEKLEELRAAIQSTKNVRHMWRNNWPNRLRRVVSLETAERMLQADERYARIDTWPSDDR